MSPSCVTPAFRWLSILVAFSTLILIAIGGLVTSHGAGMAVPDWPNTYGYNMFAFPVSQWIGGILYEHTHRLWASFVGFLTLLLALVACGRQSRPWLRWGGATVLLLTVLVVVRGKTTVGNQVFLGSVGLIAFASGFFWPTSEPAPKMLRRLALAALVLVIFQGVLGGLRVVLFKDQIGIFHATLAQVFFCLGSLIAWAAAGNLADKFERIGFGVSSLTRRLIYLTTGIIFIQLILGAAMRHQHAGLAVPDFPLAYGKIWPQTDAAFLESVNNTRVDSRDFHPVTAPQIHLHMTHRMTALAILGLIVISLTRVLKETTPGSLSRTMAWTGAGLVMVQFTLGAFTVWTNKAADIATLHVVVGACTLVWSTVFSVALAGYRIQQNRPEMQQCSENPSKPSLQSVGAR